MLLYINFGKTSLSGASLEMSSCNQNYLRDSRGLFSWSWCRLHRAFSNKDGNRSPQVEQKLFLACVFLSDILSFSIYLQSHLVKRHSSLPLNIFTASFRDQKSQIVRAEIFRSLPDWHIVSLHLRVISSIDAGYWGGDVQIKML